MADDQFDDDQNDDDKELADDQCDEDDESLDDDPDPDDDEKDEFDLLKLPGRPCGADTGVEARIVVTTTNYRRRVSRRLQLAVVA